MKWFTDRKMATKLAIGFGFGLVLTVIVGVQALSGITTLSAVASQLYDEHVQQYRALQDANIAYLFTARATRNVVIFTDENQMRDNAKVVKDQWDVAFKKLDEAKALPMSDGVKALMPNADRLSRQARELQERIVAFGLQNRTNDAIKEMNTLAPVALELGDTFTKLGQVKLDEMQQAAKSSDVTEARVRTTMLITIAVCVVLTIGLVIVISRIMTGPLRKAVDVLQHVEKADFSQQLALDSRDEMGDMARALNAAISQMRDALANVRTAAEGMARGDFSLQLRTDLPGELGVMANALGGGISSLRSAVQNVREASQEMAQGNMTVSLRNDLPGELGVMAGALNEAVGKLRQALTEVRETANSVASSSDQLAAASQEISSGAQEQASSLEETAASLEEMTATIKQNADNAQQASQLAGGARSTAEEGGQVVSEAVQAMSAINDSSKKIADIITTIDEIAFQTNLLALNAAVEAARAGEQGRGFAVVAAEVRNLAQRSATAAKEIKDLISDSTRKVEAGTALVNASGKTLNEIVAAVKRVTDIVGEIAAASREQASGIDQVNKAVTQMDSVTQANASQTEEMSGTSESLSGEATKLQSLVRKFKLGDDAASESARPSVRRPVAMASRKVASPSRRPQTAGTAALALDSEFQEF